MKLTVKDCLELNAFAGAEVLTHADGLAGNVSSVSVFDGADESDLNLYSSGKSEMLLTGFLGAKNDVAKQCRLVESMARKGCPALAVFFAGGNEEVDSRVVAAADKAELTLIRMAPEARYDQAIADIMDDLLYGENFNNSLISNTVFHLLNFEKHSSFNDAVREAAINNDFQLIILSEDFNPVLAVETRHRVTIADAIRIGRERSISEGAGKVYTQIDVNGVLTYWGPVNIGSDKYFMLIVDNEDVYTAGEITKLAEIIELAMGMWKYTPERDAKSDFIKALIRGNKSLAYNLQDEARIAGQDIISVFFSKGIPKDEDLAGRLFVTSGLGGMSGAQGKAAEIAGAAAIIAEVDISRIMTRVTPETERISDSRGAREYMPREAMACCMRARQEASVSPGERVSP